jgi:hypothetical protein
MNELSRFDVDQICDELYDPAKPGGVLLPNFLQPPVREQLLREIKENAHLFTSAPREYLKAVQEFDYLQLGEADEEKAEGEFRRIFQLRDRYSGFYREIAEKAQFEPAGTLNSIAVQRYPKGSAGITPHRDESQYVNLISIFVLAGEAPFGISFDRQKTSVIEFPASCGDLVLLRAPRDRSDPRERAMRPMHYVGRVAQERYSLTFREKSAVCL